MKKGCEFHFQGSLRTADAFPVVAYSLLFAGYPGGGGYSDTLPIWVCAAQRGRDFEAPDLERGIHFRGVF